MKSEISPRGTPVQAKALIRDRVKQIARIHVLPWLVLSILVLKCSAVADGVHVLATDRAVSYVGRWGAIERVGQTSMATINSSSQIYFAFSGQHVAGLFDIDGLHYLEQICVRVDDGGWTLFTIDRPRIEFFPAGLSAGRHHLELAVKAIDGNGERWGATHPSSIVFKGFDLESGDKAEVSPPSKQYPLLQFFGDSITQGEGVLQKDGGAVMSSDGLATYAWLAGEALGTTHAQIAFGGQGVIRSGSGGVPPAGLSFPWNFSGSPADFSRIPDFIVVNLGSNDQPYISNEFIEAYVAYLREIREHCPQTRIFALRPFHGDKYHGDDVAEVVKRMEDPAISYIDTTGWLDETDFTDGAHPNVAGSRKAGARLEEALRPYISRWKSSHPQN
jgi:lysophospholipase L1-like esterase